MADARWWIYYCSKSKNYTTMVWPKRGIYAGTARPCQNWLSWFVQFHEKCLSRLYIDESSNWFCYVVICVFMATYDPRIEAMAEFPGGGLGGGPEWQSISDSIICWSFNVIHTWILHHKIMTCCCMLLLIPVLTVKVIQQRGWKLQAASPCPHPERSSGMEPILYAAAAHPWSPTCSLLDFEQTSTQRVNSVHPTVTCHTQPTHASFFVKNINICQQRQCRSNSNQDRTSPFHMSLSSECYVLVLAGNWASVTWSDGGEGHLKGSIRPNNPKATSQRYTESHMQWSVGVPSSKLTERVELHV